MPSTGVEIDLKANFKQAARDLEALGLEFQAENFLDLIGARVLQWIAQNFKDEGTGRKWKRLRPSTIQGRIGGGGGAKALQDTGHLMQSYVRGSQDNIFSLSSNVVTVGSSAKTAAWHHFGTSPYEIVPKRSRILANKKAGQIFGAKVNHPGLPARPQLPGKIVAKRLAVAEVEAKVQRIIEAAR